MRVRLDHQPPLRGARRTAAARPLEQQEQATARAAAGVGPVLAAILRPQEAGKPACLVERLAAVLAEVRKTRSAAVAAEMLAGQAQRDNLAARRYTAERAVVVGLGSFPRRKIMLAARAGHLSAPQQSRPEERRAEATVVMALIRLPIWPDRAAAVAALSGAERLVAAVMVDAGQAVAAAALQEPARHPAAAAMAAMASH